MYSQGVSIQQFQRDCPSMTVAALVQAETKLNEAEAAEREAAGAYEQTRETMRAELVVFQNDRSGDMTRTLRDFALAQAKLARTSAARWRGLVDKMKTSVNTQTSDAN